MTHRTWRYWQWAVLICSFFVLMASFYFERVKGLQPCPLCLMQRFCVLLVCLSSMISLILGFIKGRYLLLAPFFIALAGLYFSGRQLWLQTLPADKLPACLPGLDVLMRYFPIRDTLHALLFGAADCGEVTWRWLGLSMPAWSALFFAGLLIGTLFIYYRLNRTL
jgi:disulfide bond formation protein DsbB